MSDKRSFSYDGEGGALLWLTIRCLFLTTITFGIYWPWAKARLNKFHYGNTSFDNSAFSFHGTGPEMFWGMLKGIGVLIVVLIPYLAGLLIGTQMIQEGQFVTGAIVAILGVLVYIGLLIVIAPSAVNSSMRYRFSRTAWRSIRWGYTGKNRELIPIYVKGMLLTLVTLGIYGSWFNARYYSYVYSKLHFGSVRFRFQGDGKSLFFIGLKGTLLSIITGGIYLFWYMRNLYRWSYDNLEVIQGERIIPLTTETMSGGKLFVLNLVNTLLLIVTLGIATPWVTIRNTKFILEHIKATADLDTDAIEQTSLNASDATGEELADILDLGDWGIM